MTKAIKIRDRIIGNGNPILVQSMTNVDTADVNAVVAQIKSLEDLDCEIVRMSVYNEDCAKAIPKIKQLTQIPLVADIHFDHRLAIQAMENGIDKVRINPGNIGGNDRVKELVDCAKMHKVPIRIGVNSGSLPKDLMEKYGNSVEAMVEAAFRHINILEEFGFNDIVVSLKSSDVIKTIEACKLFATKSEYPQHIGVTEAGSNRAGLIKSAIGIGSLLKDGIGDTFRVSLSGAPEQEILAAWDILNAIGLRQRGLNIISCPTCGRCGINVEGLGEKIKEKYKAESRHLDVAVMGCVVNGPGEASDADIGIAGGHEYSLIFKNGEKFKKVTNDEAFDVLTKEIDLLLAEK